MPTGPEAFLELPDACGLRPSDRTHLKNGLVPHSYASGTYDKYQRAFFACLSSVWVTFRLAVLRAARFGWVCLIIGYTSGLRGPSEVGLSPGASKRGMPTGPEAFLGLPDSSGLQPCDWTHLKNGLVPHSYAGGAYDKYRCTVEN